MDKEIFYRLVVETIKRMKKHSYKKANLEQWLADFKGDLYDELADNFDKYPEEGDECDTSY
jgi:hypothetical protein